MATKKQKRERALEKRIAFEAEVRRTGLEAQQKDRERRERRAARIRAEAEKASHDMEQRLAIAKLKESMDAAEPERPADQSVA